MVDAARFGLDGSDRDAYVVAPKDHADWTAQPNLVDVRPSGPQQLMLGAVATENRITLADPGLLSSDAGAGLGVGYDVVLDCNRNAELDAGDVLDGGTRPGLFRTHDATQAGPHAVSMVQYSGGTFLGQRTFYPSDIADLGELPLVVVTHGWSYTYEFYDYIGEHLASYGYVVMFHEANVQDGGEPGTIAAANDLLANTEYLLQNQDSVGGGVLAGHLDPRRMMYTGHSTGGEAVARAVTQLRDGSFSSSEFGYDDIRVVSSMAPVSWHGPDMVDPGRRQLSHVRCSGR